MELIPVASSSGVMLNGVAVSPGGRVFASFPRWTDAPPPCVGEVLPGGGFRTYPGGAWNDWVPGRPPHERFVNVHAVFADADNHLWVIDDATPHHQSLVAGGAKLVQIDLATDQVRRVYAMGPEAVPAGAVMGHMRTDENFLYVSESRLGAIIVVDRASGRARRVLDRHPAVLADPAIAPVVQGIHFKHPDGKVPQIHVALLELSTDAKWLYFTPLFGPVLRRVETRYLQDPRLGDDDIASHIEDVARVPPLAGITRDRAGNFYFCSITEDAILKMGPDRQLQTLISDPRISFPNEPAIGPDGCLYFPSSQAHFAFAGKVGRPYEIFRMALPK